MQILTYVLNSELFKYVMNTFYDGDAMKKLFYHKMRIEMRRLLEIFLLSLVFACFACGGGGGGDGGGGGGGGSSTPPPDNPKISNLTYSPASANWNSGGGWVTVNGFVDFTDEGGNLSAFTLTVFDSVGNQTSTNTIPIKGLSGVKVGRINGNFIVATTKVGHFTFQVYVSDAAGGKSNILEGTFDVIDVPWKSKASMSTSRFGVAVCAANGKIYAVGGSDGTEIYYDKVEEYDPSTDTWAAKSPMPTARGRLAAVSINGKIYVIGGMDTIGVSDKLEEYDPATDIWTTKAPMLTPRENLIAGALNGKIYVIGGLEQPIPGGGWSVVNKMEEYDPTTNTWTTKTPMPTARSGLGVGVLNEKIYAIGGWELYSVVSNKVEEYNPVTEIWTTKTPMPTARGGLGMGVLNEKIYAVGGILNGQSSNIVEEYDPAKDK
jgi:hypothetical protein